MKELGQQRLDSAREAYMGVADQMKAIDETYTSIETLLTDQITFMSRDLSAEAMAVLAPMAEELNASTESMFKTIDTVLGNKAEEAVGEPAAGDMEAAQ
jgi:hypothetical protein